MFFANHPRMALAMYLYFAPLAATVRFFTFVLLDFYRVSDFRFAMAI